MKKNYWLVNVPLRKYGYSFMVHYETEYEEDVLNALADNKDLFDEEEDYYYAQVEQATEYDYESFKDSIVEL